MSRHLGLIIGVNQYQDSTFEPLQFAENDARALAQWLVNTKGGRWSPPDMQLVQGTLATRELVTSLIVQTCINITGPGDIVLIYFAGHAFVDEKSGEGYLALTNTRYQDTTTGIHLSSLAQQVIGRSRAAHILFILDCFQTGRVWNMRRSTPYDTKPLLGPALLNVLQQQKNRLFLCSCRGNEFVSETGERGLGTLAHRMIVGLCGSASDPATGNIAIRPLHTYLFNNLGEQQRPQLFGQDQPPLVLVENMSPPSQLQQSSPAVPRSTGPFAAPTAAKTQTGNQPVAQAPAPSARISTSHAAVNQHRQQQCQLILAQAQQHLQAQNYAEAFNLVEQVLQINPGDPSALLFKAQLFAAAERYQEALAVVEQLVQIDANNPLAWSTRAIILTNIGQHQAALVAIEHSLELDANNPESYLVKTKITANIAAVQTGNGTSRQQPNQPSTLSKKQRGPSSFLIGMAIQVIGFVMGSVGSVLPIFQPKLPIMIGLLLVSIGLALLCVNSARGPYCYGARRLLPILLISLVAGGLLGILYKFGSTKILQEIAVHPNMLVPMLFLGGWLAAATLLPLLMGFGGLLSGLVFNRTK